MWIFIRKTVFGYTHANTRRRRKDAYNYNLFMGHYYATQASTADNLVGFMKCYDNIVATIKPVACRKQGLEGVRGR